MRACLIYRIFQELKILEFRRDSNLSTAALADKKKRWVLCSKIEPDTGVALQKFGFNRTSNLFCLEGFSLHCVAFLGTEAATIRFPEVDKQTDGKYEKS